MQYPLSKQFLAEKLASRSVFMSLIKKNYSKFSCQEFNSNLSNDIDKKAMNITEDSFNNF